MTKAATGWTIRMVERVDLVEVGRSKSLASPSVREAARVGQHSAVRSTASHRWPERLGGQKKEGSLGSSIQVS